MRATPVGAPTGMVVPVRVLVVALSQFSEVVGLARERAGDLIAESRRVGVRDRDRAGADDLTLGERLVEAREGRGRLGAGEAQATVALGVGAVRTASRAGVERHVAAL